MERKIRIALVQFQIVDDWLSNMAAAESLLIRAKDRGADLAVLPEIFVGPYSLEAFVRYAEPVPDGRTCERLHRWSESLGLAVLGGSLPERDQDGRIYNTATLWDPEGELVAVHRKVHLFDVDLPGGVSFMESSVFSPGGRITTADVLGLKVGLAVCYDVRFPEMFRLMALAGAEAALVPGAFNPVSGPAHWELHLRGRAVENTMYVAGVSGISPPEAVYQAWGHSMVVDPFGEVLVNLGRAEGVGLAELDPARLREVRERLPLLRQRRDDLYELWLKKTD